MPYIFRIIAHASPKKLFGAVKTCHERSGKSSYAEQLALSLSEHPVYVATAHIWDEEFRQRVLRHQERRGAQWTNIEEERALSRHHLTGRVVVIDCITLWCVVVPLGLLAAFVWKLPVIAVAAILTLDEFVKIPAVYIHYKKYKWVKNITRDE